MALPSALIETFVAYVREHGPISSVDMKLFYDTVPELKEKASRDALRWRLSAAIVQSRGRLVKSSGDTKLFQITHQDIAAVVEGEDSGVAGVDQCSSCQQQISLASSRAELKKPCHVGQWRNHSITGYCCAIDADSTEGGRYVRCRHPGGIIQSSHWSCCGNRSHFSPPCGVSEDSPSESVVKYFDHIVCATGTHRICKKCVGDKIRLFNDQFRTGGARSMLSDTGPVLCPCDYVLPAKVAIACVPDLAVVNEYTESIVKMKSEIVYTAFQKSFVRVLGFINLPTFILTSVFASHRLKCAILLIRARLLLQLISAWTKRKDTSVCSSCWCAQTPVNAATVRLALCLSTVAAQSARATGATSKLLTFHFRVNVRGVCGIAEMSSSSVYLLGPATLPTPC